MKRGTRILLLIGGLATICSVGTCGVGLAVADSLPIIAGCTDRGAQPETTRVSDNVKVIREQVPALKSALSGHYIRVETRPRTCPDLYPMTHDFFGFAVLPPDESARWAASAIPNAQPVFPEPLRSYAPKDATWKKSHDFDFDPASRTVYFRVSDG